METQIFKHKVNFQVSLDNGETIYEGKGDYQDFQDGRPDPWQRLLRYIVDNGFYITSISLYTDDGLRYNLPTAGKNPKFKAFSDSEKPIDYDFFRKMGREAHATNEDGKIKLTTPMEISDWYTVGEAIFNGHKLQIWVDELNPKNSWTLLTKI